MLAALPELIKASEANFEQPDAYPVDARGVVYSFAFFSSKHLGKGQFYLMTIVENHGQPLDGAVTYRLTVPADVPVTQYWSATVYNRDTHTLLRDATRAGRSSQSPGLITNDDGSIDLVCHQAGQTFLEDRYVVLTVDGLVLDVHHQRPGHHAPVRRRTLL